MKRLWYGTSGYYLNQKTEKQKGTLMLSVRTLSKRATRVLVIAGLIVSSLLPLLRNSTGSAQTLNQRSITISSSKVGQAGAHYDVSFNPAQATGIQGIAVQFCQNSPLIDNGTCSPPAGMLTPTSGSINVTSTSNTPNTVSFAIDGASNGANLVILTDSTGLTTLNTSTPVTFSITGITNTTTSGTFFARIATYATTGDAVTYSTGLPGTHIDDGGIAMSTTNQITINARVQEQLQFCAGSLLTGGLTPETTPADCGVGFTGTIVDLGVIDSNGTHTPVDPTNGGNNRDGALMVRTNAANGVVIDYFAEPDTTAGTPAHQNALRVPGATCNAGVVGTDQCFDSAGFTVNEGVALAAGTEGFGMTISGVDATQGLTGGSMQRDGKYDGDGEILSGVSPGTCTAADAGTDEQCWFFDESGSFSRLASSANGALPENRVVDDEMLLLRFAAIAGVTTPTGSYTVVTTYVATATY